jgi:hypothetical protein
MKTTSFLTTAGILVAGCLAAEAADPLLDSWLTQYSGKYARLYATTVDLNAANAVATWSRGALSQSLPAYSGVQEIYSSANWLYLRTTGLGGHVMGPWYLNAGKTMLFPNLPLNQKALYRIPRNPAVPGTKTLTGLGVIGYFVDGVAMFDGRDAFYWNGTSETQGNGLWNRDAYVNEGVTFDPGNAHQQNTGVYHYHANPIALRSLLADHVLFNPANKTYSENPTNLHHSPILGWVRDGHPIYGPYGFSNTTNGQSGIRRMISGFVPRNGANGTANLSMTGRTALPAWAGRFYNRSTTLAANEYGPNVSATYPLGRYLEDNDYLGDLGKTNGADFDLDEHNGRFCVTPEFPGGVYAYFVTVASNGTPVFPYNIGRAYHGTPTGNTVGSIAEPVSTNFMGGASMPLVLSKPAVNASTVTLVWSSVEGGTYQLESSSNLSLWTTNANNVTAQGVATQLSTGKNGPSGFYRATRTGLANYDPAR